MNNKKPTNIAEYLARFNENNLINTFEEIVKADAPTAYFCDREVDILDIEMFFEEHCVAIGEDGIADLIANEYNKRAEEYFGLVTNEMAKELAISALKSHFLYDGYTMFKADSPFASAFDWLEEKYTLCHIVLDFDGEETMIVAFDFSNVKFDIDVYINADWGLYSHEIDKIVEDAKAKIHE